MSGWNYRIVRHRDPLPKHMLTKKNKEYREKNYPNGYMEWFAVHEVFYNSKGKPDGVTKDPIRIVMDEFNKKEFKWVLKHIGKAMDRPILDYDKDFKRK